MSATCSGMTTMVSFRLCMIVVSLSLSAAFQVRHHGFSITGKSVTPSLQMVSDSSNDVEAYLNENHPIFVQALLSKNDKVWKSIREEGSQSTIFAPTDDVFVQLGDKRRLQFADDRNRETVEKIAAYHVINEPVTVEELFASGGVITLGGEIPVDRSVTGGFFGVGGKEDGGVTINGAKVTESTNIGNCIIHSVDKVVSPQLLWRYLDQLRIPGSS